MRFLSMLCLVSLAGCASTPERKIASSSLVSPMGAAQNRGQVVDAVIARLGPVRNQGNTQLCFAHAVADVASFHAGRRVSAFSVAVRNFQHRTGFDSIVLGAASGIAGQLTPASRYMMGLASTSLEASLHGALCADDQREGALSYRDENLKALWHTYHEEYRPYFGPKAPTHLYRELQFNLVRLQPSLDSAVFMEKLSRYTPLDHALGDWFDKVCDVKVSNNGGLEVKGSEKQYNAPSAILRSLDEALEGGEPAVVHYDPGVLRARDPSFWKTLIGTHVSVIVARTELQGERFYLLRNSWGPDCSYYADDISQRCDRGHIWLSEREISAYVTSAAYYWKR